MERKEGSSRPGWITAAVGALVLAGLLAALSTAVISGFASGAQPQDVLRRTPTPTSTRTPRPPTNTPTDTFTPTFTFTPTNTNTPTFTPTPFTPKPRDENLVFTTMIGGSTGSSQLNNLGSITFVPMFDGAVSTCVCDVQHLTLPGAITHLEVILNEDVPEGQSFTFAIVVNGQKSDVSCTIPSKKGDFCADGNKNHCLQVGKQDLIAVQSKEQAQLGVPRALPLMSWVAKLDLFATCPA